MEATTPLLLMLPVELGLMVLERLEPRDVCLSFAPVCRQANALAAHPLLWSSFYRSTFLLRRTSVSAGEDVAALMYSDGGAEDDEEEEENEEEEGEAVRRRWDRLWLLDAGMTVGEAIGRSYTIDWKAEYIRRLTFKVLVLAHHGAHGGTRYDIDLCHQLKKQDINHIRICHPDCQASSPEGCKNLGNDGFECVPFSPDVAKDFSAIILFHATAPSQKNRVMMGNVLYEHLESGGGLVMCCYAYLSENQLAGKWTSHFYPMPNSSFGSPEPKARTSDPRLGVKEDHPIMNGIRRSRVKIDNGRDTARCKTYPQPGATVVARYADGPPLVVLYDSKANEANSKQPPPVGDPADGGVPWEGLKRDTREPRQRIEEEKEKENENETETNEDRGGATGNGWGKTVFVNLFPVSNANVRLGGWYPPAPRSDIPRLLANALNFVARRKQP